ncbi:uncharacterized protein JN550_009952 [Neoarthrinium moseri]|uniref:uncharacterized protein n=1 Tax=Neoarthrinium moseri TaxID=1658444 RepID=UPI001FDE1BA6|nr:uncharacterized protein JN550_009952 [Neoarthrinium moseri]KAI1862805.1 hypothetical protein JN550_009952 [Neoarthrinium moseri]
MEVVGCVGAVVGLAGSSIKFLKRLDDLITAVKEGPVDLSTAQTRIRQHERFLTELKDDYAAIPMSRITNEERVFFDGYIQESENEVNRFKTLLEKVAKQRTRGSGLQKLETAARMQLNEKDIQKYKSMLQYQMSQLQIFELEVDDTLESIVSSLTHGQAEDRTMHMSTQRAIEDVSESLTTRDQKSQAMYMRTVEIFNDAARRIEAHHLQAMSMHSSMEAHVATIVGNLNAHSQHTQLIQTSHHSTLLGIQESLENQVIPAMQALSNEIKYRNRDIVRRRRRSPHEPVESGKRGWDDTHEDSRERVLTFSYASRTYKTPFGRLYVSTSHSWNRRSIAYGVRFEPSRILSHNFVEWKCLVKTGPHGLSATVQNRMGRLCEDVEVIRALGLLLDERRFTPGDFVQDGYGFVVPILELFYPEYYRTFKWLLDIGCRSDVGKTQFLMNQAIDYRCHVLDIHPDYAHSDYFLQHSVPKELQDNLGEPVTGWYDQTFELGFRYRIDKYVPSSHLSHLLPYKHCAQDIVEVIYDLGGLDTLMKDWYLDHWLLVGMGYMNPELLSLVLGKRRDIASKFTLERVVREMQDMNDTWQLKRLMDYFVMNGNLSLVRYLIQSGFDVSLMLDPSVRRGDDQVCDLVLRHYEGRALTKPQLEVLFWNHYVTYRMVRDITFRAKILDKVAFSFEEDTQNGLGRAGHIESPLLPIFEHSYAAIRSPMGEHHKMQAYFWIAIEGCISRYENMDCRFPRDLRLLIHDIATYKYESFRHGINYIPQDAPDDEREAIKGYSPLMIALWAGMKPVVKILIRAGADITKRSPCGISALQLAECNVRSDHPRVYHEFEDGCYQHRELSVSSGVDRSMLQMLRDALRNRGEEVPSMDTPAAKLERPQTVYNRLYGKIQVLLNWVTSPAVNIDTQALRDRRLYIAVVWTFGFLSIAKLLQPNVESIATGALRLLSRPIFAIPILAWVVMTMWQRYSMA